jgi:RNA polymerase sigma factor (sigma-70 family)
LNKESLEAAEPVGHRCGAAVDATMVWNLSDESLLAGLGSGDPEASSAFVHRFERRVFGLTLSVLRDHTAAEEAAQETFLRAWRHASTFDPKRGTVPGWLLTIARNVSINMLPARRADPVDPEVLVALDGAPDPADGIEARVVDSAVVREALLRLPEEQRRAVVLAAFYGYTAQELSELDDLPLGTVKTRVRSAMLKLRSELGVHDER